MSGQFATKAILNALHFSGVSGLSNKACRGKGSILMLHRVENGLKEKFSPNSHLSIRTQFLEDLLKKLSASIFEFVDLDEAVRRIKGEGRNERPFVAISLDDGYRDNLVNAVPLFRRYNVPYTIYVAPGLIDGRANLWWEDLEHIIANKERLDLDMPKGRVEIDTSSINKKHDAFTDLLDYFSTKVSEIDQRRLINHLAWQYGTDPNAHRKNSIMTWNELSELAKDPLCTLGAHTIHHYAVARLSGEEAKFEMSESARLIKMETGKRPKHFSYPYGYPAAAGKRDFDLAARSGFDSAVTTRHGVCYASHADHLMALPRISVNGNYQKYRYIKTLISGVPTMVNNRGKQLNVS